MSHLKTLVRSPVQTKYKKMNQSIQSSNCHNNQNSQNSVNNPFLINCQKHKEKIAEKLCINPNCEHKEVVFCSECLIENQQHAGLHRETVISYQEFIEYCKTMSIKFKEELGKDLTQKQYTALLLDLNKQTDKFKQYIVQEEQKLDDDFDALISQFDKDIKDIKEKIKQQINAPFIRFQELSQTLVQKAKDLNQQRLSNYQYNNDFDEFLQNVQLIQQKPYNMKKLLTNLSPFLSKQNNLIVQQKQSFISQQSQNNMKTANNVLVQQNQNQIQQQNYDTVSNASGISFCSNFTLNLAQMPYLAPLKDIYHEFKELLNNKPVYRNKGIAHSVFKNIFTDSRKLYYQLLDVINEFVVFPESRTQTQQSNITILNQNEQIHNNFAPICKENFYSVNQNKASIIFQNNQSQISNNITAVCNIGQRNYTTVETCEDMTDRPDLIDLKQSQKLSEIDFIRSIPSSHKGGIICIKVLDDNTFVTGGKDKTVKIWQQIQIGQFEEIKTVQFKSEITSVGALNRNDGSQLVVCGLYKSFAILNQNFDIMKTIETEHEDQINQLMCLKDGETVITTSTDPRIAVWNVFQVKKIFLIDNLKKEDIRPKKYFDHRDVIYCLELFPSNNYFASAGRDRNIKVWRLVFFKEFKNGCLEKIQLDLNIADAHNSDITALKASQEYPELLFSGASNGEIKIWEVNDGILLKVFKNYSGWVYKLILFERPPSINPNLIKQYIVKDEQNNNINENNNQNCDSIQNSKLKKNIKKNNRQHNFSVNVNFQNNNQKVNDILKDICFFSASFDGTIKIWEANQIQPVFETKSKNYHDCYPFGGVSAFKLENSEKIHLLMTGNKNDSTINLWSFK